MIWDGFFDSILIRLPLLCLMGVIGGWVLGLFVFVLAMQIPERPPVSQQTDGIIVLTGGPSRLAEGVSLWRAGATRHLLVSGVHNGVTWADLRKTLPAPYTDQLPNCCLTLDHDALSTRDNITRARAWIDDNKITTIRLVTARYHMPRAMLMMMKNEPALTVLPHPVDEGQVVTRAEISSPEESVFYPARFPVRLIIKEYHKTLVTLGEWVIDAWTSPHQPQANTAPP